MPTQEQLDRWAEEMKHWEEAKLVNKEYYAAIKSEMDKRQQPTVGDAMAFMAQKGNKDYVKAFPYLLNSYIEQPFKPNIGFNFVPSSHGHNHLYLKLGHTPEQEQFLTAADAAAYYSVPSWAKDKIDDLCQKNVRRESKYYVDGKHRLEKSTLRDKAVYYAARRYFEDKIGWFTNCLENQSKSLTDYESRKSLLSCYATDLAQDGTYLTARVNEDVIKSWPYEFLAMSREEWRMIICVATELVKPEETPFPKRMGAIYKDLREAELLHDMKPGMEEAVKKHSENHPKGEAFDPEKFKAARAKRGADTPERG